MASLVETCLIHCSSQIYIRRDASSFHGQRPVNQKNSNPPNSKKANYLKRSNGTAQTFENGRRQCHNSYGPPRDVLCIYVRSRQRYQIKDARPHNASDSVERLDSLLVKRCVTSAPSLHACHIVKLVGTTSTGCAVMAFRFHQRKASPTRNVTHSSSQGSARRVKGE